MSGQTEKKVETCQVCGESAIKRLSTTVCSKHYQAGFDSLVNTIIELKLKESVVEVEELPTEPVEQPEQPTTTEPQQPPLVTAADKYGIHFLYPNPSTSQMWYMNMDNPSSDTNFGNEDNANLKKEADGAWSSDGSKNGKYQVRLEGWVLPKIVDCEITTYANYMADAGPGIQDPGAYAYQVYRGGGHHTSNNNGCEGASYKARIRKDRSVVITKEVRHPDYTNNRGGIKKLTKDPKNNYIGIKLAVYNLPEKNGVVPVKIEVYCDESGMDTQGILHPEKQNWVKMAETIDDGDWAAGDGGGCPPLDMKNGTGKRRPDEILNMPGGTSQGNIGAYRTDGAKTKIKYFSIRKIQAPIGA